MTELELLYSALNSRIGIVVTTSDPNKLKQRLYALRRKTPAFRSLSFLTSRQSPATELWILNGQANSNTSGETEEADPAV